MVPDQQSSDARSAGGSAQDTGKSRWVLLGIGGFVLGLVGSFGLLMWRGASGREVAQLLAQVEADMQAKRWEAALDKTRRVLATQGVQQPLLDRARSRSDKAEAEVKNRSIYARFSKRAGDAQYDAALQAYRELPKDSAYYPQAVAEYGQFFPIFVDYHLQQAEEARKRGDCSEASAQAEAVLDADPRQIKALMAKERPCTPSAPTDDTDSVFTEAQTRFVNGDFAQAIALSRSVMKSNPVRAWRIIGGAACHLKDSKLASEAYRLLDVPGRQYLVYACQREETPITKTSAPPPASSPPPPDREPDRDRRRPAK